MRSGVDSSILESASTPSLAVVTLYPAFLRLTSRTRTLRESASTRRSCCLATGVQGPGESSARPPGVYGVLPGRRMASRARGVKLLARGPPAHRGWRGHFHGSRTSLPPFVPLVSLGLV